MNFCCPYIAWPSLLCGLIVILASGTETSGQELDVPSPTSKIPILDTVIDSWPVDATMTRDQECAIWAKLCQPYTPIAIRIPLDRWVDSIATICPIEIDEHSLESIGLTSDVPVTFRLDTPPQPLLVHVLSALESLECVIEIRHGVVRITTEDSAERKLSVRIYDVSTLTGDRDGRERVIAMKFLMDTIQNIIDPDGWEHLGGSSVLKIFPMKTKQLLCAATTTQTHWKLQSFLDQLQRAGGGTPEPTIPNRRVSSVPKATRTEPSVEPESREPARQTATELPRFRPQ